MKKYPKVAWATWVNLAGATDVTRVALKMNKYTNKPQWWARGGSLYVEKMGYYRRQGYAYFASENKSDVEKFALGVKTTMTFLKDWIQ